MKSNFFEINAKLPSLNEVIAKNRANRYVGAKFKKDIERMIAGFMACDLKNGNLHEVKNICELKIIWFEKDKRRDVDNIQSSQKFILDAMVKRGILKNDSRKYVKNIYHEVVENKGETKVRVEIWEEE